MSTQYSACCAASQTGLSPTALRASKTSSAVMEVSWRSERFERPGLDEGAALESGGGIGRIQRSLRFDLGAERLRTVLRDEAQMGRLAVVPPAIAVRRHSVHDRVA